MRNYLASLSYQSVRSLPLLTHKISGNVGFCVCRICSTMLGHVTRSSVRLHQLSLLAVSFLLVAEVGGGKDDRPPVAAAVGFDLPYHHQQQQQQHVNDDLINARRAARRLPGGDGGKVEHVRSAAKKKARNQRRRQTEDPADWSSEETMETLETLEAAAAAAAAACMDDDKPLVYHIRALVEDIKGDDVTVGTSYGQVRGRRVLGVPRAGNTVASLLVVLLPSFFLFFPTGGYDFTVKVCRGRSPPNRMRVQDQ